MIGGEAMIEKDYNLYILVCDVCVEKRRHLTALMMQ